MICTAVVVPIRAVHSMGVAKLRLVKLLVDPGPNNLLQSDLVQSWISRYSKSFYRLGRTSLATGQVHLITFRYRTAGCERAASAGSGSEIETGRQQGQLSRKSHCITRLGLQSLSCSFLIWTLIGLLVSAAFRINRVMYKMRYLVSWGCKVRLV